MYAIWNPLGLAFKVGGRLHSMSDPSGRDVKASDSKFLDRKEIDLLRKIVMEGQIQDGIGHGYICPEKEGMIDS